MPWPCNIQHLCTIVKCKTFVETICTIFKLKTLMEKLLQNTCGTALLIFTRINLSLFSGGRGNAIFKIGIGDSKNLKTWLLLRLTFKTVIRISLVEWVPPFPRMEFGWKQKFDFKLRSAWKLESRIRGITFERTCQMPFWYFH